MQRQSLTAFDRERIPTEAASRWCTNPSLEHVQDSESFVYRVTDGTGRHYLRITDSDHRTAQAIESELEFVEHLANSGVAVARPYPSRQGPLTETIDAAGRTYVACLFPEAPGSRLVWRSPNWNADSFRLWGAALAQIHRASKTFSPRGPRRFDWSGDEVWLHAHAYLSPTETAALAELHRVRNWFSTQCRTADCYGMIHGDFCAANFHVSGTTVTAFDFDDCCYHWFLYDIVCALSPSTFRPPEERRPLRDAFVEGYQQEIRLPADWKEQFDWLLRMRGLYLFLLNVRNWDGDLASHPKRPLLDRLRKSFDEPVLW